jgi:hypothetical protein
MNDFNFFNSINIPNFLNNFSQMEEEKKIVPEDANENCPGIESNLAGKMSSCNGCPNQKICSSGQAKNMIEECTS